MAGFTGDDLTGSRFERVDLSGSEFLAVDLSGSRFRGVALSGSVLRGVILELCDGTLTAAQIAELIAQTFDLAAPPDEEVEVNEALAQLAAEGLTR
jgi:uncharacterized protein YjbI with pentapeptide repeats